MTTNTFSGAMMSRRPIAQDDQRKVRAMDRQTDRLNRT